MATGVRYCRFVQPLRYSCLISIRSDRLREQTQSPISQTLSQRINPLAEQLLCELVTPLQESEGRYYLVLHERLIAYYVSKGRHTNTLR